MAIKKIVVPFAAFVVALTTLMSPASAATGRERFTETIRATLTPSGPIVSFSHATAGGLIRGIGTVSLDGMFTIETVQPDGPSTFTLGATTTNVSDPDLDPCGTVTTVTGTFEIALGSGTGAFANVQEKGTFVLTENVHSAKLAPGRCSAQQQVAIHLVAIGTITAPSSSQLVDLQSR